MVFAVILAGGSGTRMKSAKLPKQFLTIGSEPILRLTLNKFLSCPSVDHIILAAPAIWMAHTKDLLSDSNYRSIHVCEGGASRQDSLYNALKYIEENFDVDDDTVVVSHDVARPFVSLRIIEDNIRGVQEVGAVDTVIPATDTIVQSLDGSIISNIPDRAQMYQGQTPQSFKLRTFARIYETLDEAYLARVTDAARILVEHGCPVKLVQGELFNIKITTEYDFRIAEFLLGETR